MNKRLTAVLMTLVMIFAALMISAPRAAASGFWISNDQHSYRTLYLYNKAGCTGAQNALAPGHSSSLSHDWKTIWVPAHTEAHFLSYSTGYSYYVQNPHSWKTCHNAGSFFDPTGWHIKLIRL